MTHVRAAALAAILVIAASDGLSAQPFPSDAEVQAMIQQRVDAGGAVGITVGLLEADGSVRTYTAGSAGEGAAPLTASTLFEIGSITKVFTATLLAEMVGQGEVSLDDPVQVYLPEGVTMPTRGGMEITLADLSTHRSGLPRLPTNMAPADMSNPYVDYTAEMMYEFLSSYELPRDIGAEFEYSNLGTGLLGYVLALRLGVDYEEAVRVRILAPLGMDMTGMTLTPDMSAAMAKGHDAGGEIVPLWDVATLAGAGGLRSDVGDMLVFMDANVGEPATDLERSMRTTHAVRTSAGPAGEIGLNWITRTTNDQRIVWHNGGTAGFRTFAGFDPDAEVAVVVLTNSGIGADDIGFHLLNPEIELSPPPLPENVTREAVQVDPGVLERYVGEYQLAPQAIATFTLEAGRLYTQLTGQPRFPVYAESETVFFLRVVDAEIEFQLDASGEPTAMILRQGGQTVTAEKIR